MGFDANILAILAGGLSAVLVGFIWYSPMVFGRVWMALARLNPVQVEESKKKMPLMAFLGFSTAVILSWVIQQFTFVWGVKDLGGAMELGFWIWLGFMVPVLLTPVLWEQKSFKYFVINAGYWLVSTLVIAGIVSVWI
ncbi:hypothetical protein COB52_00940 [Candidatus Kaiserbacteria bacterium]|nr:MAG: hypothetical protein COB52_00940 [Candidatus Kaiserbacteria bacterium]